MSLRLYMDVHVHGRLTKALLERGIDVIRAQDDGAGEIEDPALLARATELGRVLVTYDDDLLREAHRRQASAEFFQGVILVSPKKISLNQLIEELEIVAESCTDSETCNGVIFIPL